MIQLCLHVHLKCLKNCTSNGRCYQYKSLSSLFDYILPYFKADDNNHHFYSVSSIRNHIYKHQLACGNHGKTQMSCRFLLRKSVHETSVGDKSAVTNGQSLLWIVACCVMAEMKCTKLVPCNMHQTALCMQVLLTFFDARKSYLQFSVLCFYIHERQSGEIILVEILLCIFQWEHLYLLL